MRTERITIKHIHSELIKLQQENKKQGELIMNAIENLNAAVNNLNATVASVQTAIAALKVQPNNDAAIQSAADSITSAVNTLNSTIQ